MKTKKRLQIILGVSAFCICVAGFLVYRGMGEHPHFEESTSDDELLVQKMFAISIVDYCSRFKSLPGLNSSAISKAMSGDNPKGLRFIKQSWFDADGRLVDGWHTPLDITISTGTMKVTLTSAGEDKILGTGDDRITTESLPVAAFAYSSTSYGQFSGQGRGQPKN